MTNQERRSGRVDLDVARGLIAGAALGAVLMALTGNAVWLGIGPGVGLLVGLVAVGLLGGSGRDDDVGAASDDGHGEEDGQA